MHLTCRLLCRKMFCILSLISKCDPNVFDLIPSYPFNPKTFGGFLVAFTLQCIVLGHIFIYCTILVSFGINSYLFGITSTKFLISALHHTNESVKSGTDRLAAASEFNNFIELQSAAKQLSYFCIFLFFQVDFFSNNTHVSWICRMVQQFSDMFQPIIALLFIWCIGKLLLLQYAYLDWYQTKYDNNLKRIHPICVPKERCVLQCWCFKWEWFSVFFFSFICLSIEIAISYIKTKTFLIFWTTFRETATPSC